MGQSGYDLHFYTIIVALVLVLVPSGFNFSNDDSVDCWCHSGVIVRLMLTWKDDWEGHRSCGQRTFSAALQSGEKFYDKMSERRSVFSHWNFTYTLENIKTVQCLYTVSSGLKNYF